MLAYQPPQLSVEAYVRSVREEGTKGSGLLTTKHARSDMRLRTH
jgi:hypothetical protein